MSAVSASLIGGDITIHLGHALLGWQFMGLGSEWYGLSDPKTQLIETPADIGAMAVETEARASMSFRLRLKYRAEAELDATRALEKIRALAARSSYRVLVHDHDGTTERLCHTAGFVPTLVHAPCTRWSATLDCLAADPRRYSAGEWIRGGSEVKVCNIGSAPVSPVVEVTGASGVATVTEVETGRVVQITRALTSAQRATLDRTVGLLQVNGTPMLGLGRAQWPEVPAGGSRTYRTSRGTISVLQRSGWW